MKILFIFLLIFGTVWGLGIKDIVIVILSQPNEYHHRLAVNLKEDIEKQAQGRVVVHLSHEDFPHVGHWTILPLIPKIYHKHGKNSSWIVFIEDRTKLSLEILKEILSRHDEKKAIWLGHALHDIEATIIHHFAFYDNPEKFKYPNLASGIALSTILIQRLNERLERQKTPQSDFGIDSSHELALFIWDKGKGQVLTHDEGFCTEVKETCASFPTPFKQCSDLVGQNEIYFAVKTCSKFHEERLPVVKKTWAKYASKIAFFSDSYNASIPTVNLGVPNTDHGHCAKTLAILHHVSGEIQHQPVIKWVVVADDDTILGIRQLLTCYNSSKPIALGERYGYNVHSSRGYNYITGGGGMVFSRSLLSLLTRPGVCECPIPNAPDDMFLGVCIASLGLTVTHSPLFHQARPIDYPPQYLQTKDAVSFHKHWMIDPVQVYKSWFAEEDVRFSRIHDEF